MQQPLIVIRPNHPCISLYKKLYDYGVPIHYEVLTTIYLLNTSLNHPYWNDPDFKREVRKVQRALYRLVKESYIRRVRPGVYSAFGSERD